MGVIELIVSIAKAIPAIYEIIKGIVKANKDRKAKQQRKQLSKARTEMSSKLIKEKVKGAKRLKRISADFSS